MQIVSVLTSFFDHVPAWLAAATSLVTAASAVSAITPTPRDDQVLSGVLRVLNVLALNVGHAQRSPISQSTKDQT
ncbi:MAG TPA: hypothetical protein VEH07_09215 [Alphaproteobacteria bacterium]|nr:hypothetical protein [Alphaproteobacteria bacterium]